MRWRWWLAGLIVLAGLAAGCSRKEGRPAAAPYKIGAIFSVSGPGAPLGVPERDTVRMLEQEINAKGGIDGHPLQVVFADDASQETKAVLAVKRLIQQDRVLAIIGPSLSGTTLACMKEVERAGIPMISCAAGNKITNPPRRWVFKTAQSDILAVAKLVDYMVAKRIKTAAIICDSNAFGLSGREQLERQLPVAGIKLVARESFTNTDTDMTAQLTRIKAAKPQAIICWGTNPGPAIVTRNARQLGIRVPLLHCHGIADREFLRLAGKDAEGVVFPAGRMNVLDQLAESDPQYAVLHEYDKLFRKAYQRAPDHFGAHAWDAMQLLTRALAESGPAPARLRESLEQTRGFVGAGGVYNFSPGDHNGMSKEAFVLVTVAGGKWTLVK